jgi:S-DNA-T family DNA segregation ATPase FtsK/SpoIIIE
MFGLGEDDRPVGLLLKVSTLIVGESRSGKSSTVWAMVASTLEQAKLPSGEPVEFWVIDQSQTEFAAIQPIAARYAKGQGQAIGLLRALWGEAANRARSMGEGSLRVHAPTAESPRIVLIVDEMLHLVSKKLEPKDGKAAEGLLFMLLTQAAKYGIVVWCGTQAGKVNIVGDNRDFFQQRICHSAGSKFMTDAALGDQAYARGADCHKLTIPFDAGIGWMRDYERSGYRKFRSVWVPDDDVAVIGRGESPDGLLAARGLPTRELSAPGAVYVMWGPEEADGMRECLYVGQTRQADPADRWRTHLSGSAAKEWADEVAMVKVHDCQSAADALSLERQLIHQLRPKHNIIRYVSERVG